MKNPFRKKKNRTEINKIRRNYVNTELSKTKGQTMTGKERTNLLQKLWDEAKTKHPYED